MQLTDDVQAFEFVNGPNYSCKDEWCPTKDEKIQKRVRQCRGFHVGSYQNMLFKRCYYLTEIPTVVFIHDKKIDCDVRIGKCHYLFDEGFPWTKFASTYPLSLWIGCERSSCRDMLDKCNNHFINGEWSFVIYGESNICPIIVGHNKIFRKCLSKVGVRVYGS